jgi:phosphoribosylformimino-5-aminoimidazole carboxamide ribotide isomerase
MRVIPVIDVLGGRVVRAIGGRRSDYQPVQSRLTSSTNPLDVARALVDTTGAAELYAADLDSIIDPSWDGRLVDRLCDGLPNVRILLDIGVRTEADLAKLHPYRQSGRIPILGWPRWRRIENLVAVIGTETLETFAAAAAVSNEFCPELALSVDLIDGRWVGRPDPWADWGITAESRVQDVIDAAMQTLGCVYLILLDLAVVGTGRGPHPYCETLVRQFRDQYAGGEGRELLVGGGIRGPEDVRRLADAGADGVLVASALHDGTLSRWPAP